MPMPIRPSIAILVPLLFLLCVITNPAAGQECLSWQLRADGPISPRERHAMAYDVRHGVSVLFGGRYYSQPYGDTWEWDGSVWTEREVAGPEARSEHAMVYDRARGVTVLFGGTAPSSANPSSLALFGDTWEWDGDNWLLRSTDGPPPRIRTAMAYDSRRGVTVLFGGTGEGARIYGDTWEWNADTWALRSTTGPSPRSVAGIAYDEHRGVVVLFGGADHQRRFGDTWEWDGTTWTISENAGPPARYAHSMVYDSRRGAITVFGGDPHRTDTREFLTCLGDLDDDGVPDVEDECPNTVLSGTVMIGDCDTGVADQVLDNGCTMTELIASCKIDRRNHGHTVRCVLNLVRTWRRDGVITSRDQGRILRCAARPTRLRTGAR